MTALRVAAFACLLSSFAVFADVGPERVVPETFVGTTDISDIWWVPAESGWGLQVNQSDNIAFVTVFVYGPTGQPGWFTAILTYIGGGTFTGTLFLTTGTYYAVPWNPASFTIVPAGTFTFTLLTATTATITYTIGPVTVTKSISRQPLRLEPISGNYSGWINLTASGCTNPASNAFAQLIILMNVAQSSSVATLTYQTFFGTLAGPICTLNATYTELGRLGNLSGPFSCTDGNAGTLTFSAVTNRVGILSADISGHSTAPAPAFAGCTYSGRFSGVNPAVP